MIEVKRVLVCSCRLEAGGPKILLTETRLTTLGMLMENERRGLGRYARGRRRGGKFDDIQHLEMHSLYT